MKIIRVCFLSFSKNTLNSFKFLYPDILHGGDRNPYQLKKAMKSSGTVFAYLSLAKESTRELYTGYFIENV
jgi:hypothetical protein